jgi:hypothetical protein
MARVMASSGDPETMLLQRLALIAEKVFSSESERLITEPAIRQLLAEVFRLLALASENQNLSNRLLDLYGHGALSDALKEDGFADVAVVDSEASTRITTRVRDKWFPDGPQFYGGPKVRGP